jgi:type II secretory pathway predicted ATPase ExeA
MSTLPKTPANFIFFFGISSSGWKYLTDLGRREQTQGGPIQPLMRRFGEPIELTPLDEIETKELIESRLKRNRITRKIYNQPLIPYDDTFVNYVFELSLGNPGDIVKYCDYALEEGLREKIKTLNKSFAERAFVTHGLITAPE